VDFINDFKKRLFYINEETFQDSSLALFDFQYHQNGIYRIYCDSIKKTPSNVKDIYSIPFLPIEFFKNHEISSSKKSTEKIFKSSGTTSSNRSQHHIKDLSFYHAVSHKIFESNFGKLADYTILALLPSYKEQGQSSLISMVDHLMKFSQPGSGYFLEKEINSLIESTDQKILIGVSFALIDLEHTLSRNLTVIETGGMKGRKKEITRAELHERLKEKFKLDVIWSEYGMTELMSQAYGINGLLKFPNWASALIREVNDPFALLDEGKTGGINVIDLANIESCAFIETKDLGIVQKNKSFEVVGRFDNSDIRGCNLLV